MLTHLHKLKQIILHNCTHFARWVHSAHTHALSLYSMFAQCSHIFKYQKYQMKILINTMDLYQNLFDRRNFRVCAPPMVNRAKRNRKIQYFIIFNTKEQTETKIVDLNNNVMVELSRFGAFFLSLLLRTFHSLLPSNCTNIFKCSSLQETTLYWYGNRITSFYVAGDWQVAFVQTVHTAYAQYQMENCLTFQYQFVQQQ